jgi:hypothetical protein
MKSEEIEKSISQAYSIVSKTDIKEEALQVEAFKYALRMSSTGAVAHTPPEGGGVTATNNGTVATQNTGLAGIAKGLDVPYEVVELFYDIAEDELTLNLPPKVLPDSASAAMREIAILLSVGRKHAGMGVSTTFDLIRTVCDDNGKLDKKNFAAAMSLMKPKLVPSGKGTNKELVPKRPADDLAKDLILKYNSITG